MNAKFLNFYVNLVPVLGLTVIGALYLVLGLLFIFYIFGIFLYGALFLNILALICLIVGYGIVPYRFKTFSCYKIKTTENFEFFILFVSIIAVFSLFFDRYYLFSFFCPQPIYSFTH